MFLKLEKSIIVNLKAIDSYLIIRENKNIVIYTSKFSQDRIEIETTKTEEQITKIFIKEIYLESNKDKILTINELENLIHKRSYGF